jgi:poly-gamma-glutamate synthase PgsB/CapB
VTGACAFVFAAYLLAEKYFLDRKIKKIPLRICVTGTRGKSSVTRLIAACLGESGMPVLAKTTGSKPCLILPDGKEQEIMRQGRTSILEGKMVMKVATKRGVQALVQEMMSIHPESLQTEALRMLKPHILVITNVRLDHLDAVGNTKEDMARCFASGIPKKSTVFVPEEEFYPVFRQMAEKRRAELILVPENGIEDVAEPSDEAPAQEFEPNIRLAVAVADFLGKDRYKAYRAAIGAHPDFGSLKVWKSDRESTARGWYFVSAFAANDPESTREVLDKLEARGLFEEKARIGLLNLRQDRGDRTKQWLHALREKDPFAFDRLVLIGDHAPVLRNKLKGRLAAGITVLRMKKPEQLTARLFDLVEKEAVVIGIGNMGGMGQRLVDYWERIGARHDL